MIDQFNKIAKEGILQKVIKEHNPHATPVENAVMLRINLEVGELLDSEKDNSVRELMEMSEGNLDMDEVMAHIHKTISQTLFDTLNKLIDEYQKEGDWESFGFVHYIKGTLNLRR